MDINTAIALVILEVNRATQKFPTFPDDPLHAVAILNEEVGELNKAVLQQVYEPKKNQDEEAVEIEAIQAAAMSIRFLMSCNKYQYKQGKQHKQKSGACK